MKIIVAFAQIVFQLGPAFNIVFPVNFLSFLNYYSLLQLNIFFLPAVGCIVQTNFYDDLFIATISPFVLFALVAITLYLITLRAKSLNHRNPYYTPL